MSLTPVPLLQPAPPEDETHVSMPSSSSSSPASSPPILLTPNQRKRKRQEDLAARRRRTHHTNVPLTVVGPAISSSPDSSSPIRSEISPGNAAPKPTITKSALVLKRERQVIVDALRNNPGTHDAWLLEATKCIFGIIPEYMEYFKTILPTLTASIRADLKNSLLRILQSASSFNTHYPRWNAFAVCIMLY